MESITVHTIQNEARADSLQMAQALGNQHKNVLSLIDDYLGNFEELGRVAFQTRPLETPGGKQKARVAYLNENQCYFLLTLVRNSDTVVRLKLELVKAFDQARRAALPVAPPTPAQQALIAAQALVNLEERTEAIERRLNNAPIGQFPEQEGTVHALCQELGRIMPGGYPAAYRAFKAHFGQAGVPLAKYTSLPSCRFDEACGYLRGLIAEHSQGRLLGRGA